MNSLIKVYAWLSGIVVAFSATYLTAIIATLAPPPKELLCTLGLGFCPLPKVISFNATDIDRISDRDGVGQGPGENQIGMLHNRVDPNVERSNMVTYKFVTETPGDYKLRVFYASPAPRSVDIFANGIPVAGNALSEPTGGGDNKDRKWSPDYLMKLPAGENTLMVKRSSVFPHLSKFEITQLSH
jgi:hypothetical protein